MINVYVRLNEQIKDAYDRAFSFYYEECQRLGNVRPKWVYGTAIAEPRFSYAKSLYK